MAPKQRPTRYRSLVVWQKAMDLVDAIYDVSESWPQRETYRLVNQVRRAVVSVPANIAEGHGKIGPKEYLHHRSIADGSLCETETLVTIARRRTFIDEETEESLLNASAEVEKLLNGLIRGLQ